MSILVIGEVCRDVFNYGSVSRVCPEGPVPVLNFFKKEEFGGMALNTYLNVCSLTDSFGNVHLSNRGDIVKERFVDEKSGNLMLRVDSNDRLGEEDSFSNTWADYFYEIVGRFDAIVISDYCKGFLSERNISDIKAAANVGCPVFLDTKKEIGEWCRDVDFLKINDHEFSRVNLNNKSGIPKNIIVTRGASGSFLYKDGVEVFKVDATNHNAVDVSGAGDSYLAGLVVGYMENDRNIKKAMEFASMVAGVAVSRKGVTVVKREFLENK